MISLHIREAFLNLVYAKLRAFLAILGVLVGTASIVALLSSSQLATEHAIAQFKSLGTNLLALHIRQRQTADHKTQQQKNVLPADIVKLENISPDIQFAAPYINLFSRSYFAGKKVGRGAVAATAALQPMVKLTIAKGRFISPLDRQHNFCVVGATLAKTIRQQNLSVLGEQLKIGNAYFTIIGILEPWKNNLFFYTDINRSAIIPLPTAYFLNKKAALHDILFRLVKHPDIKSVQQALTRWMAQHYPKLDLRFHNPEQIIHVVAAQRQTFSWLLAAIGGIALLVGGIGVMNIMLVSVVERRREIGIRLAIGARRSDIRRMFLIEAVILTLFGGVLGIMAGLLVTWGITLFTGWAYSWLWLPIILGFTVSVLAGILSGFYPASRAAQLNPIETLQSH